MAYTAKNKFSEKLLSLLENADFQIIQHKNSKRKVFYKISRTDDGLEIRRATNGGEYPDKEGYRWFVAGTLNLETVDKALDVVKADFINKRNSNPRVEAFKKRYYSVISDYGEEFADYLLEDPELFLQNVKVNDPGRENGKYWNDVKYKEDIDEWVYWSVDSESILEHVAEQMICENESEREDGQYGVDEYEDLSEKAGGRELNCFCGGVARQIKSCVGFERGCYGSFGLRFDGRFHMEFKEFDVFDGDPDELTSGDCKRSLISFGATPESIADNISIREGDLAFKEDIEERQGEDDWNWNKVCADAVKKIEKELGKGSVYFSFADYEEGVAEYVVGNEVFACWFKQKWPETDLKSWLRKSIVDEDGEYYDHSFCDHFSFEEWWKESFESE